MTQTIINGTSIASGGGTATGTFSKVRGDKVVLRLSASSGGGNLDVDLTGGKLNDDETSYGAPNPSEGFAGVDASTGDLVFKFSEPEGYEDVEFTVTNNATSSATVTVTAEGYGE